MGDRRVSAIEDIVSIIPFERDPYFPHCYSAEAIEVAERHVGGMFPDDFKWYLLNVGWRKIDYDHRSILIRNQEYLYDLRFEGAEPEVFFQSRYKDYLAKNEGGLLEHDKALYVPFSRVEGDLSPTVSLRLLISLNKQNYGSIWAVRPIGHFDDQTPSQPIAIADDIVGFLRQIGPNTRHQPIASKNNDALFRRLVADYTPVASLAPTVAADAVPLLEAYFDRPSAIVADGVRNVEFQRRLYSQRFENDQAFAESAAFFASFLQKQPALRRRDIRIGKAQAFDRLPDFDPEQGQFRSVTVDSVVGGGNRLKEEFLLYHDKSQGSWTLVRRHNATIEDVKIKGVGTFSFNSTFKWKLKKKTTPAWSDVPFELHVSGEEDALTETRIDFIKEVLSKEDFRVALEAYVFDLYTTKMHPEFEAMEDDEKADWANDYPKIDDASEIWQLIGKRRAIYIENDREFHLQTDASWDPEHGLSVGVEDWRLR